jgi:hypothetical protein
LSIAPPCPPSHDMGVMHGLVLSSDPRGRVSLSATRGRLTTGFFFCTKGLRKEGRLRSGVVWADDCVIGSDGLCCSGCWDFESRETDGL